MPQDDKGDEMLELMIRGVAYALAAVCAVLAAAFFYAAYHEVTRPTDIGGGCGQLWFVQDWMAKHPTLARPSIGRTIPIVHAPREHA